MKHVKFVDKVPDFEQLLISPDLSKNALKGILLHYERNREKMEHEILQYRKNAKSLEKQLMNEERGKEDDSDLNETELGTMTVEGTDRKTNIDNPTDRFSNMERYSSSIHLKEARDRANIELQGKTMDVQEFRDRSRSVDLMDRSKNVQDVRPGNVESFRNRSRNFEEFGDRLRNVEELRDRSRITEVTKEHELAEFRKESNTIKTLQAQISILTQERDTALAMWSATEKQLQKLKHELDSPRSNQKVQYLLKETQNMQKDYSDAIHLLESKLLKQQEHYNLLFLDHEKLKQEIQITQKQKNEIEDKVRRLEEEINKITKDKSDLSQALEKCLNKVEQVERLEEQARGKVSDAVSLAQQALTQQDSVLEEKMKLEKELKQLTNVTNIQYKQEIEQLFHKIQLITKQLESTQKEKSELSEEFERIKLECYNKLKHVIEKNKSLSVQCKELHNKNYTEKLQWSEERKMLRSQIMSLQSCIEQVNTHLRYPFVRSKSCLVNDVQS